MVERVSYAGLEVVGIPISCASWPIVRCCASIISTRAGRISSQTDLTVKQGERSIYQVDILRD